MFRRSSAFQIILTALLLTGGAQGTPQIDCERIYQKVGETAGTRSRFWSRARPVTVPSYLGEEKLTSLPFAFGIDAELWRVPDIIRLSSLDARGKREVESALRSQNLVYDLPNLRSWLGVETNEEVLPHILPSKRNKTSWTLLDLEPESLRSVQHDYSQKTIYGMALRSVMQATFDRKRIPLKVGWEGVSGATSQGILGGGQAIELTMKGPMTVPAEFRDLIKNVLYANADAPETHFHLSIPSGAASPQALMMAARALEMKITLDELAANLDYDGTLYPYDGSVLAYPAPRFTEPLSTSSGVVRISVNRWETPVNADDIEFRQWIDPDHALDNMRFMMALIQKSDDLADTARFKGTYIKELAPANLHNSLGYAAHILSAQLEPRQHGIVRQLRKFQQQIKRSKKVTPEKRAEIAKYIKEKQVMQLLTLDSFMANEE